MTLLAAVVGGTVTDPTTQDLVVELLPFDCLDTGACTGLFIGANSAGQSAPSYIAATDCGVNDPVDLAGIGFPDSHVVMVVNGDEAAAAAPTMGQAALLALALMLLAVGASMVRRRAR